jgi:hypothetical protein
MLNKSSLMMVRVTVSKTLETHPILVQPTAQEDLTVIFAINQVSSENGYSCQPVYG